MRVKCVASVSPVIWRGDRESVVQSLPIKDMREALLLGKDKYFFRFFPKVLIIFYMVVA